MQYFATLLKFQRFSSLCLDEGAKCQAQNAKGKFQVRISYTNKNLRLFIAGAINIVGLAIVTTTMPVFLCTSETYMDFVLNAAATLFIVQLDDLKVDTKMGNSGLSPPPTSPSTDDADIEAADYHFPQSASQEDEGGGEEEDGGGGEEEDGAGGGEEEED